MRAPISGWAPKKEPHTRCEPVKTKPVDKHVRTTTENQEENSRSVSVLSFLSWHVSFCPAKVINSHIIFLPPSNHLQIAVVNKLLCSEQSFLNSSTFPMAGSQQGPTAGSQQGYDRVPQQGHNRVQLLFKGHWHVWAHGGLNVYSVPLWCKDINS